MAFDRYMHKDGRRLRLGYTTGSCAALAAGAAARMLLSGKPEVAASLVTPSGVVLEVELADSKSDGVGASCAVRKDAGDDPDITDGMLVYASVRKRDEPGVAIGGGTGVGKVTRPGLDQPPGAAAINRVPRRMIEEEVLKACRTFGYGGGMSVIISIPGGENLAGKTFNPDLGVVGGLSIIGTSGLVEPMSAKAIVDTIETEMRMLAAEGVKDLVATPGNYGERFIGSRPDFAVRPRVRCSNHIGETLDFAKCLDFESVLLVGHAGKLVKLAGGIMDTHSRVADCRTDLLALHAALAGAESALTREVFGAATADAAIEILDRNGLREGVFAGILERIDFHLRRRAGGCFATGAVLFSNHYGCLGATKGAEDIMAKWGTVNG